MKKRITVALVLVIVLSITVGMLTGCDEIFKKNDERDMQQVVATVRYENQVSHVYKSELASSFNNYAYYYVSYYGMTYQATADYIVKTLAQRELLVLFAKEYVGQKLGLDTPPELLTLKQLLNDAEYDKAIRDTNEDMLSALNSNIKTIVADAEKNSASTKTDEEEEDDTKITDPVKIYFRSNGGSAVENQKIQKGKKAKEPTAPTRTGYTFYGWYTDNDTFENKFDFSTAVSANTELFAKWEKYLAPRTVKTVEEVEEVFDADAPFDVADTADKFFSDEYQNKIKSKEIELDDAKYYEKDYLKKGLEELKKTMSTGNHDYEYYLNAEMKTLLIAKLERLIGKAVTVTPTEIEEQFAKVVAQNKETFASSATGYSSALTSALATTYFHKLNKAEDGTVNSYGFVVNILLKMNDTDLKVLTDMVSAGTISKKLITEKRDALLNAMMINVSNPDYDAEFECENHKHGDTDYADYTCDPMTCDSHTCNDDSTTNDYNKDNNYDQIISFEEIKDDEGNATGKWEIKYNCHECPSMAYLLKQVSATGDKGITAQIAASIDQINAAVASEAISPVEGVYWTREMASAWLYLVGDDAGGVSTDSNNGGLGYLITPEGETSSYLEGFTDHARKLIAKGTGSYSVDGTLGKDKSYVYDDNFIESGTVSSAYAGIFFLVATHVAWDVNNAYGMNVTENDDGTKSYSVVKLELDSETGILPMNYIVKYAADLKDCVTIEMQIKDSLLKGKKSDLYNLEANTFGVKYAPKIEYNEKAYKSLWKSLD